jgi:hypothetical protein
VDQADSEAARHLALGQRNAEAIEFGRVAVAMCGSGATVRSIADVRITRRVVNIPFWRLWFGEDV